MPAGGVRGIAGVTGETGPGWGAAFLQRERSGASLQTDRSVRLSLRTCVRARRGLPSGAALATYLQGGCHPHFTEDNAECQRDAGTSPGPHRTAKLPQGGLRTSQESPAHASVGFLRARPGGASLAALPLVPSKAQLRATSLELTLSS